MENISKILKNVAIFLIIFLTLNFIFSSFQNEEPISSDTASDITVSTKKDEYSRLQTIILEITNNTDQEIVFKNECPNEPFDVFRKEKNQWVQKSITPDLDCSLAEDITLAPGKKEAITYENWNYEMFGEMGVFHIEVKTDTDTFTSNEFNVVEEGLIKKLWNAIFYKPIYNGLMYIISLIPGHSLGLAIILLTLLIRTILLIPNGKALRSQQKLQEIQPKLDKIKEKYKGDQQKISLETMQIWKESKVNPLGSCLPMLLQFPFLIALFYVIKSGLNPDNTHLLYTTYANLDFANINVLFLGILDLTKANVYVLPLIVGGLQFFQIKLSTASKKKTDNKKEKKEKKNDMAAATGMMMYFMPVMIAVFTASMPAGVGLYWGTSTLYGIFQQLYINKSNGPKKDSTEAKVRVIQAD